MILRDLKSASSTASVGNTFVVAYCISTYLVFRFQNIAQIFLWLFYGCSLPECNGILKYSNNEHVAYLVNPFPFLLCLVQRFGGVL